MNSNFFNIPDELQQRNQWVNWVYSGGEDGKKQTKIPVNPLTKQWAKKNDASTWTTFEEVCAHSVMYDGIGFMFSHDDPYVFIDFDETEDVNFLANQQFYFEQLDSYSERSPGGEGLHILVRGKLSSGRRRNKIEVYPYAFATMTGDVVRDAPIRDVNGLVGQLWESLEGVGDNAEMAAVNTISDLEDDAVFKQASEAKNGEKFVALWGGDKTTYHGGDHSRADFALIDILAFYTQDRGQIARMFRASGLGQRPKANRSKYVQDSITKAFDNIIPKVDFVDLMENLNQTKNLPIDDHQTLKASTPQYAQPNSPIDIYDCTASFDPPPGLTGEIAEYIYKQAWKPVKQISIIGALGLMAGLTGRAYNVNGTGLNLYLLLLAKTGRGKDEISKAYSKLFKSISPLMPTFRDFKGPSDIASGQALLRYMFEHKTKSAISVIGEFGPMLKRITSPTAISADLMTQKVLLHMYSKSGTYEEIDPTVYSQSEKNIGIINSPGFSFVAESAPKWFDSLANDGMIETGLLPRFIISQYDGIRVPSNELGPDVFPSQKLSESIMGLATQSLQYIQSGQAYRVQFDDMAMTASRALDRQCDKIINDESDNVIITELWNRVHLNTIKVAAVIAVGINPYNPVIDMLAWSWAEKFVTTNANKLIRKFDDGGVIQIMGDSETTEIHKIEDSIVEFLNRDYEHVSSYAVPENMHRVKVIPWAWFSRRLTRLKPFIDSKYGANAAIKRAVANLVDNGELQEISKPQAVQDFNFHGRCFAIRSTRIANRAAELKKGLSDT